MNHSWPQPTVMSYRVGRLVVVLASLALVLAACGGESATPDPTAEPVPPTATTIPTPAPAMGQVVFTEALTSSGQPENPASEIPRSATTIVAAVDVQHVQPGTTYTAEWTMDGIPIPGLEASTTLQDGAASGWVSFTLTWDGATLWPVGQLGITITSSSGETVQGSIPITST